VILAKESVILYRHFQKFGFGVAQYAWPLLKNAFAVVLEKDDWLRLIDHLFTHHNKPELLFYFLAGYLIQFKSSLTKIYSIEEMFEFTETQHPVQMKTLIKEMFRLEKKYRSDPEVYFGAMNNHLPLV
jgi:hypothetical protein